MTEDKARKRAIRTRMAKTGESYTAARRHVVKSPAKPAPRLDVNLGKSDESILKGSGKSWDEWFAILDKWGATKRTHGEIARYVNETHGVSGWWSQTVAVGYERGRGMRKVHQGVDGSINVSVSKTLPYGAKKLFEEFTDARKRNRWLERGTLRTRTSRPNKSARFDFENDGSRVHVYFDPKGRSKTTVSIQHERLPDELHVEKMRAFWKDRLAALAERLVP